MDNIPDVLKLENVVYSKKKFNIKQSPTNISDFLDNYNIVEELPNYDNIKNNIFIIDTLHGCWAHSLIDFCFAYFWAIQDIKHNENKHDKNKIFEIIPFITSKKILQYKNQQQSIDNNLQIYKFAKHELMNIISSEKYIFEHLLDSNYSFLIKECYIYKKNHFNNFRQRTPWNSKNVYRGHPYNITDVLYENTKIKNMLKIFKEHTYKIYNIKINKNKIPNIIIINRIGVRNINDLIKNMESILMINNNNQYIYNGIVYLENKSLKEQIQIFNDNNIIITPHGANLANCIWTNNSTIIEIMFKNKQTKIYEHLCNMTNNNIIQIDYNNIIMYLKNNILNLI